MTTGLKGDFPTYWTTFGHGSRSALMFHCWLARSEVWRMVASQLDDLLAMTAFDAPGHGESADWDERGEIQGTCVKIAADFLDGPTDLIGHSFGATVALRLAVEHPELVRSLVLVEPPIAVIEHADFPESKLRATPSRDAVRRYLADGDRENAARVYSQDWGDGRDWNSLGTKQKQELMDRIHMVPGNDSALIDDVGGLMKEGVLESIAVPTLLIEGEKATESMQRICAGLERRLPDAKRVVIKGAGHMAPITHPRPVALAIREHLKRRTRRSRPSRKTPFSQPLASAKN